MTIMVKSLSNAERGGKRKAGDCISIDILSMKHHE